MVFSLYRSLGILHKAFSFHRDPLGEICIFAKNTLAHVGFHSFSLEIRTLYRFNHLRNIIPFMFTCNMKKLPIHKKQGRFPPLKASKAP